MVRTYKPRPLSRTLCLCGCGQTAVGRADKQYVNGAHRKRAHMKGKRGDATTSNTPEIQASQGEDTPHTAS